MPQSGDTFGDFVLRRELGRGAMGTVWEADQPALGRQVAIKILNQGVGADPVWVARFKQEAAQAARLSHPGILPVYGVGETAGLHWFAMEKVEGEDLARRLGTQGPFAFVDAARHVRDAARALQHAHEHGVVHRDIKPANLMLRDDGRIAVTDFGLSKELGSGGLTTTGLLVGTPYYMSPELVRGEPGQVGPAADVYGLGVTLYELLTGEPPFVAETAAALLRQIAETEPIPPARRRANLPRDLDTIVRVAMAKDPRRRFASAAALADDLERFLAHEPLSVSPPGPLERVLRFVARHRLATGLVTLALALVVGLTIYFLGRLDAQETDFQRRIAELLERARQHAEAGDIEDADDIEKKVQELGRESPEAARLADEALSRALVAALRAGRPLTPEQRRRLAAWAQAEPVRLTLRLDPPEAAVKGMLISASSEGDPTLAPFDATARPAGLWRLHASAPGRATTIVTVMAAPGTTATLDVRLPRAEEVPPGMLAYGGGWFPPEGPDTQAPLERLLPPYLLAAERVTLEQYAAFLRSAPEASRASLTPSDWRAGEPPRGLVPTSPILGLTREQAAAYAKAQGGRLPSDHELIHATAPAPLSEVLREALSGAREGAPAAGPAALKARLRGAFDQAGLRLARLEGFQGWDGLPELAIGGPGPNVGQPATWPRFGAPVGSGSDVVSGAQGPRTAASRRMREVLESLQPRAALRLAR